MRITTSVGRVSYCTLHDNTRHGLAFDAGFDSELYIDNTIFDSNGTSNLVSNNASNISIKQCEFYNGGSHGIDLTSGSPTPRGVIENCNFVLNNGHGITATATYPLYVINCGFGSGTKTNTSGQTNGASVEASGSVTYAADTTPWVDPANGDFRISLATAKGAGYGAFTQTASSYTGAVGYPDIGAAQHQDTGGGAGGSYASC
jgi:hypothetical protein